MEMFIEVIELNLLRADSSLLSYERVDKYGTEN